MAAALAGGWQGGVKCGQASREGVALGRRPVRAPPSSPSGGTKALADNRNGSYARGVSEPITPYAELDALLVELLGHWREILGDNLAGAYLQGSFALGAGDRYSDCDWLVATHDLLTDDQIARLRALHDELPTRSQSWCKDLEGSYAPIAELASTTHLGRKWLFNDHGRRTLEWDEHCNRGYTRWLLREHGITLTGPRPADFMAPIAAELLRAEAAAALRALLPEFQEWIDIDALAWGQRYAVVTACRMLFTLATGTVTSKSGALEWAMRTLAPRWRPLLAQVRDERSRGWNPDQSPRPGEADAARAFILAHVDWRAGSDAGSTSAMRGSAA